MTVQLANYRVDLLMKNNTKQELAEQLAYYKSLDADGNVYHREAPKNHSSLRQLIATASGIPINQLGYLLDISYVMTDTKQERPLTKYNRNRNLLMLGGNLSSLYRKDNKTACPRVKNNKETGELLAGCSSIKNMYPDKYVKHVKDYLKNHPLKDWHSEYKGILTDTFNELPEDEDGVIKWKCVKCDSIICKNSRYTHLKSQKCSKKAKK